MRVVVDGLLQLMVNDRRHGVEIGVRGEIHPDNVRALSDELNDALERSRLPGPLHQPARFGSR